MALRHVLFSSLPDMLIFYFLFLFSLVGGGEGSGVFSRFLGIKRKKKDQGICLITFFLFFCFHTSKETPKSFKEKNMFLVVAPLCRILENTEERNYSVSI